MSVNEYLKQYILTFPSKPFCNRWSALVDVMASSSSSHFWKDGAVHMEDFSGYRQENPIYRDWEPIYEKRCASMADTMGELDERMKEQMEYHAKKEAAHNRYVQDNIEEIVQTRVVPQVTSVIWGSTLMTQFPDDITDEWLDGVEKAANVIKQIPCTYALHNGDGGFTWDDPNEDDEAPLSKILQDQPLEARQRLAKQMRQWVSSNDGFPDESDEEYHARQEIKKQERLAENERCLASMAQMCDTTLARVEEIRKKRTSNV